MRRLVKHSNPPNVPRTKSCQTRQPHRFRSKSVLRHTLTHDPHPLHTGDVKDQVEKDVLDPEEGKGGKTEPTTYGFLV